MITEVLRWDCVCEKCGNTWTTRSEAVSKACPGCKSWQWNSDVQIAPTPMATTSVSEKLESLGVSVGLSSEEVDEDEEPEYDSVMWSDEIGEYDRDTGETTIYRQRKVKPFDRVIIRKEH